MSVLSIITAKVNHDTRFEIQASAVRCGSDWSVTVIGGTLHHVGGTAICYFDNEEPIIHSFSLPEHKDELVARLFARNIADELHCTVSVNAGIHIDNATKEEIAYLVDSSIVCCRELLKKIKNSTAAK